MTTEAERHELLRLATAGSVDDGKSTLIGRLLLDTKLLLSDQLEAVSRRGGTPDLAAITDGLRAEREQGITIDVAYRYFATPRRTFILADTPGHERYTRNMFTGASTADLVIVLIDARAGVLAQTRRHAQIAALLRMPTWSSRSTRWTSPTSRRSASRRSHDARELGQTSDCRTCRSCRSRRWTATTSSTCRRAPPGTTEDRCSRSSRRSTSRPTATSTLAPADADPMGRAARGRLPARLHGQLAAGTLPVGDEVVGRARGCRRHVPRSTRCDPDREARSRRCRSPSTLATDVDVGRGDVLVAPDNRPPAARELDATICWMAEGSLAPGRRYALKHTTRTVRATVQEIIDRWDPETLEVFTSRPSSGSTTSGA